jgi:hypothetical protein
MFIVEALLITIKLVHTAERPRLARTQEGSEIQILAVAGGIENYTAPFR